MPSPTRIPLLLAALGALAACAPAAEPSGCATDDRCPRGSRCASGVCVADLAPVAAIRPLPAAIEAFALVELDGSESADPDRGDAVAEHRWSFEALEAPCDAPATASTSGLAQVRFGCPGRYAVSLVVRDRLGVESAAARQELQVSPAAAPPAVTAGPDLVLEHACAGAPLVCRPAGQVALTARSAIPGATLRWTVLPPLDRPLDEHRRVTLAPGSDPAAPRAIVETDGTAISGDWIFRVEARDAYGVVGAAHTRVTVTNRPPAVVAAAPAAFPHAFDREGARFVSSGAVPYAAADPDGDPLTIEATWRHVGDGAAATFDGELLATAMTFSVAVPYGAPEDAFLLAGGPGLSRTLELVARDPNRAEGRADLVVEIGNRPPEPVAVVPAAGVPHRFDAAGSRYVAEAVLATWRDPDGDPLAASAAGAPCERAWLEEGAVHVECAVAYEGVPAVQLLAKRHAVSVHVRDPWAEGPVTVHPVTVTNSAPAMSVARTPSSIACALPGVLAPAFFAVDFQAAPTVTDADGDPVVVAPYLTSGASASPLQAICTPGSCVTFQAHQPTLFGLPRDPLGNYVPPVRLVASDGAAGCVRDASPVPHCP